MVVEGETISSVGTQRPQGPFDREIDCGNNVLMPGLVNAHTHIPMTLLRGYGGGCDLHTWLNQWIFPTEAKLDGRAVRAGTGLALAELIAGGVTTIADMYMHTTDIAQTVLEAGISANLSCGGLLRGPGGLQPGHLQGLRQPAPAHRGVARRGERPDFGGRLHPQGVYLQRPPVAVDGGVRPGEKTGDARPCLRDPV
ncbi:MAG: amidohydrolase family protein [Evtepia gabavorous]